jgi:hypothetical protein
MSDTILAGKLTVWYEAENRQKRIRWTGTTAKTDVQKMIDVYSAAEDLMTQPTQQDDGLIFSAETPGEYTIGKIDAGEIEPWFIDMKTMEHIIGDYQNFTGCALKTSGWTRVQDSNTGIVVVPVTSGGAIVVGDIGLDITHASGDAGTLLDVIVTGGATDYLWIRPDSSAAANNFDTGSGNLTCNAHVSAQASAPLTGEMTWGNLFTQGALQPDTHVFLYQNGTRVTASDSLTADWWPDGHIDRAIPIRDYKTAGFPVLDLGYLTVKANQYTTKYTYAIVRMNTTSGGNVSAGLSSGADITNTTGYASITVAGGSGNWNVGDEISGDVSGARAIITMVTGANPTPTLHYYYIGDPITAFNGSEAISNEDDTGAATSSGAVANQGPALAAWFDGAAAPTVSFTSTAADVNDDTVNEYYGIVLDLNQCSLAQLHEWNKYVMRRGSVTDLDGLDGQEWIGVDYAINYASITGTVAEGATVTGATSGATGVVVSNPGGATNTALLRNSRGTFVDGEAIEVDGSNRFNAAGLTVSVVVPVAEASFGTLAGTTFFASRGVLLTDYKSAEENSFSLIDVTGTPRQRPTSISMSILNLLQYDWATCFRLTGSGGSVNKTEYTATGGEAIGAATLDLDSAIAADVPGKTLGGSLVLVDVSDNNKEYVIRYDSYNAATGVVTLSNIVVAAADGGTDTDTIVEAGAFTNAQVGDIVINHTRAEAVSYVTEVTDANTIQISPAIAAQTTGDSIELNCVPVAVVATDKVYFPIIFEFMTAPGTASASMQYIADIFARVRVRNTDAAAIKIKGFTADVTIGTSGGTASATRIENTVYL